MEENYINSYKGIVIILISILLLPLISAEDFVSVEVKNRINPDSIFYGLDIALEKISLRLARTETQKIGLGLYHAQERLIEIREMRMKNNLFAEEKALIGLNQEAERFNQTEIKMMMASVYAKNNITLPKHIKSERG